VLLRFHNIYYVIRYVLALAAMIFIWLLLFMIYSNQVIPPFGSILPYLTPWKFTFESVAGDGVASRLTAMQAELDATRTVANSALLVMSASFGIFTGYLALIYQQKQRRLRENRLLQIKNQEIARRNEFIRYISATISHEFKNNLARIKRRFNLLEHDLPPEAGERIFANFDKLFADIDIFKRIADERESGLITFERVDLLTLLKEISHNYKELAIITFSGSNHSTVIFAAIPLLKTVFENIIDNAVKYKKDDQPLALINIALSMDRDERRRYVVISFRDQGVGMSEEKADKCFYKGGGSKGGWGQGMYFAKYVVGLHAGKIRVGRENTRLEIGSEILIHLPYVEEALDV
jgi:signal transduction histidine kinase